MPYIGSTPTTQNFISGTDYFNGTGSQTAFTLTRTVNSVNDIQVVVNNVVQQPNDAYTLSGTTLTFTSAPSSGTNNVYVRYLSTTLQSITPSYGSIIPSMLNPPNTIYWDTTQNVSIGKTSTVTSSTKLDVATTDTTTSISAGLGAAISIQNLSTTNNTYSTIYFTNGGGGVDSAIYGQHEVGNGTGTGRTGSLVFATANLGGGTSERMRIDSTGNVGIGTTSPTDTAGFSRALDLNGASGAAYYARTNGSATNYTAFGNYGVDGYINNRGAGTIQFYNNNSERMRITSAGFLKASNNGAYFSPTSSNHELRSTVDGNNVLWIIHGGTNPYGPYMRFSAAAPNNTSNYYLYCDDTTQQRIVIYSNGNIVNVNGSYGTISDAKNKENIVDATPKLDDVMQLKVRNFNFKTDPDLKQIGFVAQEFEQVFPAMVEDAAEMGDDGKPTGETSKTIKMSVLVPILTKAIQEQQAMIEELKARIETLEAK